LEIFRQEFVSARSRIQWQKLVIRSAQNTVQHTGEKLKSATETEQADREHRKDRRIGQLVQPAQGKVHR